MYKNVIVSMSTIVILWNLFYVLQKLQDKKRKKEFCEINVEISERSKYILLLNIFSPHIVMIVFIL